MTRKWTEDFANMQTIWFVSEHHINKRNQPNKDQAEVQTKSRFDFYMSNTL